MPYFVTVKIPGTKSKPLRSASFMRVSLSEVLTGIMTIDERATESGKTKSHRYALQECTKTTVAGPKDRHFRLTKPGGAMWYFVCLSEGHDIFDACECVGFEKNGNCKHLQSLRALLREGHLC